MRTLLCLFFISVTGCDSLWTGFREPNQNSCTFSPGVCEPAAAAQQEQGPDTGFSHDNILANTGDTSTDGLQVPLAVGEKLHSCGKVRFSAFINILQTRGIDIASIVPNSAGDLLTRIQPAAGVANFPGRVSETIRNSKSSLIGLHDVVIAAAEEWVPAIDPDGSFPKETACSGAKLFDNNICDKDGFACLMGGTPTQIQLNVCTSMINNTTEGVADPLSRRRLAVAAMFGSVAMCD